MFDKLVASVQSGYGRMSYAAKKNSPEICLVGAIVTGLLCVITACRASTKLKDVAEDHKARIEKVHEAKASEDPDHPVDEGKALTKETVKTAGNIAKLYAIPVVLGGTSLYLLLKGHNIMASRNAALALEAATAANKLDDYRRKVIERFGEDVDDELSGDVVKVKKKVVQKDPETGEEQEVEVEYNEWNGYSDYARVFESGCRGWEDPEKVGPYPNIAYLKGMQDTLQHILETKHYLTLNDAYDLFGYCRVCEGDDKGWLHDPRKGYFDKVDFGLYNPKNTAAKRFINGEDDCCVIDFNVRKCYINNEIYTQNEHVMNFYAREKRRMFCERDV